jgi:hypothetical protein
MIGEQQTAGEKVVLGGSLLDPTPPEIVSGHQRLVVGRWLENTDEEG